MLRIPSSPSARWHRTATVLAIGSAVVIGGWSIYLATTIPTGAGLGWDVFWVVLDATEAAAAAATAAALVRHDPVAVETAVVFSALLALDAIVDLISARPGLDATRAIFQAVTGEVPFALAGLWLARKVGRAGWSARPAAPPRPRLAVRPVIRQVRDQISRTVPAVSKVLDPGDGSGSWAHPRQ